MSVGYYDSSYPPSIYGPPEPPADTRMPVSPGQTVTNPVITGKPPAEWLASINSVYRGVPVTAWTAGQSATIATLPVAWDAAAWVNFVAEDESDEDDEPPAVVDEPPPPVQYGPPEVNE